MARMLTPAEYGVLAILFAIIYSLSVVSESVQTTVALHVSREQEDGKVKNLFRRTLHRVSYSSMIFFFGYILLAFLLARIFEINYYLIILVGFALIVAFILSINRGIMQGKKMFYSLGFNLVFEAVSKVVLAAALVATFNIFFPSFRTAGAALAILIATLLALLYSFIPIRKTLSAQEKNIGKAISYKSAIPVLWINGMVILFYSLDIFLAKIFFDATTAGHYAIAAVLAKALFWGTQPISKAMFPISSAEDKKMKKTGTFTNAFALLLGMLLFSLVIVYFFSDILIWIFSGEKIIESVRILFPLCIAMSFLAVVNLFLLASLAHTGGEKKRYVYLIFPLVIEVIILLLSSQNLFSFAMGMVFSGFVFCGFSYFLLRKTIF